MSTKNAIRVQRFRELRGNKKLKELYHLIRNVYNINSVQANKMKFWSADRIVKYLIEKQNEDGKIKEDEAQKEVEKR